MWRLVAVTLLLVSPRAVEAAETLRIAMADPQREVEIQGRALLSGADVEEGTFRSTGKDRLRLRVQQGKIDVDGVLSDGAAVRFRSSPSDTDPVPTLRAMGLQVRGDIVALAQGSGVLLINVIPLEDYLAAVLGSEMPASFPPEALKAQAVAARTYALHKKLADFDGRFHLGSSVLHQVYGGLGREDSRTRDAVRATWGQVLTFDHAPIEAYFHASCGGRTETGAEALSRPLPYLQSVDCPCGDLPAARWTASVPVDAVKGMLGGDAASARVLERAPSGRVRKVGVPGRSVDAVRFRKTLGYTKVKSLQFDLKRDGAQFAVQGRGNGHGAGLCQWGAKVRAEQGWDYARILGQYYPGTQLQLLY